MTEPLWQPSDDRIANANLTAFMAYVAPGRGGEPLTYEQLRAWSIDCP